MPALSGAQAILKTMKTDGLTVRWFAFGTV